MKRNGNRYNDKAQEKNEKRFMLMDKKIIFYVIMGIVILGLLVLTFFPGIIYAFKDSGIAGNTIISEDKCSPPAGSDYTEESWREHMSHHPDIYKECLS